MKRTLWCAALGLICLTSAIAQPVPLTLQQAEAMALANHPRLKAAQFQVDAFGFQVDQFRAPLQPILNGLATASIADNGSRIGAGGLNASSIFTRTGYGINIQQLLWDSGRNRELIAGARARQQSMQEMARAHRANVLLRVRQAYFQTLRAQKALAVAESTKQNRDLLFRQISALAESSLRSTLDVNFAEVAVAESDILVARTENDRRVALVDLCAALGLTEEKDFVLTDESLTQAAFDSVDMLVREAADRRPEVAALRKQIAAARHQVEADRLLNHPSVSAMGVFGHIPAGDPRLRTRYGGFGVNLTIPVLNGGLNNARRNESSANVSALEQELRDLELRISREVRVAYYDLENALKQMQLTNKLLDRSARVVRLAQTRYSNGLGSIVELNQAELSRTSAELADAAARYEYQTRRALLDFQLGGI
ncbi:MAG: TolC family protein [Bryobacterales bacterium]|nr:TolC family protein [Bryobacterales bacterium]